MTHLTERAAPSDGLRDVVAFRTRIAEPDRDGGSLRYRGVDVEELVGALDYGSVWSLLVDGEVGDPLRPADSAELPLRSGSCRVDVQASLALLAADPTVRPTTDLDASGVRRDLAQASATAIALTAESMRSSGVGVASPGPDGGADSIAGDFVRRLGGEVDPDRVRAIDAYWTSAAEHGVNPSTFTARIVASTGADCPTCLSSAVGALSGPLHGGAPARVLEMLDAVEHQGDADGWVRGALERRERLMGFGHAIYRAEDPRARILRRIAAALRARRFEAALALETAALERLAERYPERVLATNVEYWAAIVLDHAGIRPEHFAGLFTCARVAGWSAHILEQRLEGRLIRPSASYVGPSARRLPPPARGTASSTR